MLKRLFITLFVLTLSGPAMAASGNIELQKRDWSFSGPFGTFDKAAMQRGFQAYREVCAGCHGMKLIAFRNFADLGYNSDEIKAIAAEYEVQDGPNDDGEMFMRPGIAADRIPSPYANDNAARANNNGALPPDLSLIAKARGNGRRLAACWRLGAGPSQCARPRRVAPQQRRMQRQRDGDSRAQACIECSCSSCNRAHSGRRPRDRQHRNAVRRPRSEVHQHVLLERRAASRIPCGIQGAGSPEMGIGNRSQATVRWRSGLGHAQAVPADDSFGQHARAWPLPHAARHARRSGTKSKLAGGLHTLHLLDLEG